MAYDTPEGRIKKRGRAICNNMCLYHFPVQQGGTSTAGIPDDVLCVNGRFVHIEYKAEMLWTRTKKGYNTLPTARQCRQMELCRRAHGITLVIDKHNINYLESDLSRIYTAVSNQIITLHCGWFWSITDYMDYREGGPITVNISPGTTIPHPVGTPLEILM